MSTKDIEAIVGVSPEALARCKRFEVVAFLGDAVEWLGARDTVEDALMLLRERVVVDDAWLDGQDAQAAVQDPALRPMANRAQRFMALRSTDDATGTRWKAARIVRAGYDARIRVRKKEWGR